jgi:hypothetical protein
VFCESLEHDLRRRSCERDPDSSDHAARYPNKDRVAQNGNQDSILTAENDY